MLPEPERSVYAPLPREEEVKMKFISPLAHFDLMALRLRQQQEIAAARVQHECALELALELRRVQQQLGNFYQAFDFSGQFYQNYDAPLFPSYEAIVREVHDFRVLRYR
jgi:hypothetical protein